MKNSCILIAVSFLFTVGCNSPETTEIKLVSPEEMQSVLDMEDAQLVDVRTEQEHNEEYIQGAQNIDFNSSTFEEDINQLDKSKPVILYCKKGGRSAKCAEKLIEAGFIKIYDLKGGITHWKYYGYSVKRRS